jgi:hypothetical protein
MTMHSLPADAGVSAQRPVTRRQWLAEAGGGCGLLGLAALFTGEHPLRAGARTDDSRPNLALNPMAPRPTHFTPKAKRVIWIFVNGGPSQVDTWDYKPALSRWNSLRLQRVKQPLPCPLHDEFGNVADGVSLRRFMGDLWPG